MQANPWGIESVTEYLANNFRIVGIVLVLWFLNMALTGMLAGRKGRDDGLWAVLALFLGPIALVLVMLLPRPAPKPEPAPPEPSNDARGGWGQELD